MISVRPRMPAALRTAEAPSPREFASGAEVRMTRAELLAHSGLSATSLAELEQFGLLAAGGYLLSGAIVTLVALWLNAELARSID